MFDTLFENMFEDDRSNELEGTEVYHGTSSKYLYGIFKYGLSPKPNKWMASREHDPKKRREILKNQPKELFVTKTLDAAKDFARDTSYYGGEPVVLSFELKDDDKIEGEDIYFSDEIILKNKISPDRLQVVYPSGFDVHKTLRGVEASKRKTDVIKSINKVFKKYGFRLKTGSKTTDRVLVYDKRGFIGSILMSELRNRISEGVWEVPSLSPEQGSTEEVRFDHIPEEDREKILDEIDQFIEETS